MMTIPRMLESGNRPAEIAPRWFVLSAVAVPVGILGQFLLAGMALFVDAGNWSLHGALGMTIAIPVGAVAIAPRLHRDVRALRHWGAVLGLLYVVQVTLAIVGGALSPLLALHVFNAGLLLSAALVIVAKIARSHSG